MADLNLLRNLGKVKQFSKDEMAFMENDAGSSMHIVLKGVFGVYINSFTDFPVRVAEVKSGSFFGEMSVIDGWPRSATILCEEDGATIVIEKENFVLLLEKAPDIAGSILNTMRNRAMSTAEAVHNAGKEVPELPSFLSNAQLGDVCDMTSLTLLAKKLRQMNELLTAPTEPPAPPVKASPQNIVKLLPEGYVRFNINDERNNNDDLRFIKVICSYCGAEFGAYIPRFSSLAGSRATPDGRVIYQNIDILRYTNIICPNCNYTDTYHEFGRRKYPSSPPEYSGNQFRNKEDFTGYVNKKNHTLDEAILSYYLNINCLTQTTTNPLRFAKAWIRLYWLYSDHKSEPFAKEAAERAHYYYASHLKNNINAMNDADKIRLNAILGELSVALGNHEQALEHYEQNIVIGRSLKNDLSRESRKRYNEIKRL